MEPSLKEDRSRETSVVKNKNSLNNSIKDTKENCPLLFNPGHDATNSGVVVSVQDCVDKQQCRPVTTAAPLLSTTL